MQLFLHSFKNGNQGLSLLKFDRDIDWIVYVLHIYAIYAQPTAIWHSILEWWIEDPNSNKLRNYDFEFPKYSKAKLYKSDG
jgi:hypothetical protein